MPSSTTWSGPRRARAAARTHPWTASRRSSPAGSRPRSRRRSASRASPRSPRRRPRATGRRASRPELGGDLRHRAAVGDHLLARRHVDAVVAGMADRRRRDAHVHLARARVAQHLHDLAGRVAAHDRVVDDDEPLAGDDVGQRVELHPQAVLAQLLAGLDERARDVAVLDEAVVLRDPARAGEPARRGVPRVGHGDDEVGLHGRLPREDLAHPAARDLQDVAAEPRVGPREVDVLEDAQGGARALDRHPRLDPARA